MEPYARAGQASFYRGDVVETLRALPDAPIGLTVTSPPYNLGMQYGSGEQTDHRTYLDYLEWSFRWLSALYDATIDGGRLCLNLPTDTSEVVGRGAQKHTIVHPLSYDVLTYARMAGWKYQTTIDWCEGNISRRTSWGSYSLASAPFVTNPNERIFVLFKGDRWRREKGDLTTTVEPEQFKAWTLGSWEIPGESAKRIGHPAPFPEELPRRLIQLFSFREDLVCDPFCGSGTTNRVAEQANRASLGIDTVADYLDLSVKRVNAVAEERIVTDAAGNRFEPIPLPTPGSEPIPLLPAPEAKSA